MKKRIIANGFKQCTSQGRCNFLILFNRIRYNKRSRMMMYHSLLASSACGYFYYSFHKREFSTMNGMLCESLSPSSSGSLIEFPYYRTALDIERFLKFYYQKRPNDQYYSNFFDAIKTKLMDESPASVDFKVLGMLYSLYSFAPESDKPSLLQSIKDLYSLSNCSAQIPTILSFLTSVPLSQFLDTYSPLNQETLSQQLQILEGVFQFSQNTEVLQKLIFNLRYWKIPNSGSETDIQDFLLSKVVRQELMRLCCEHESAYLFVGGLVTDLEKEAQEAPLWPHLNQLYNLELLKEVKSRVDHIMRTQVKMK